MLAVRGDKIRVTVDTGSLARVGDEFIVKARHTNFGCVIVESEPSCDGKVTSFLIPDEHYEIVDNEFPRAEEGDHIKLTKELRFPNVTYQEGKILRVRGRQIEGKGVWVGNKYISDGSYAIHKTKAVVDAERIEKNTKTVGRGDKIHILAEKDYARKHVGFSRIKVGETRIVEQYMDGGVRTTDGFFISHVDYALFSRESGKVGDVIEVVVDIDSGSRYKADPRLNIGTKHVIRSKGVAKTVVTTEGLVLRTHAYRVTNDEPIKKLPKEGDIVRLTSNTFVHCGAQPVAKFKGDEFIVESVTYKGLTTTKGYFFPHTTSYEILEEGKSPLHHVAIKKGLTKPPLGLKPRYIVEEQRLAEINEAVVRYIDANYTIPSEWLKEREEIIEYLAKERK